MAGPLSFAQEQALISLYRGCPFGIDARTERGLRLRGLVETGYWNELFPAMPRLTTPGLEIAGKLDCEERRRSGERRVRGTRFAIINGGFA